MLRKPVPCPVPGAALREIRADMEKVELLNPISRRGENSTARKRYLKPAPAPAAQ